MTGQIRLWRAAIVEVINGNHCNHPPSSAVPGSYVAKPGLNHCFCPLPDCNLVHVLTKNKFCFNVRFHLLNQKMCVNMWAYNIVPVALLSPSFMCPIKMYYPKYFCAKSPYNSSLVWTGFKPPLMDLMVLQLFPKCLSRLMSSPGS